MYTRFAQRLCLVIVAVLLGTLDIQPQPANAGQVLRLGLHVSKMGKLDPHFAAAAQDRVLADMVFNGLVRYKPGMAPQLEPDLAVEMPGFEMKDGRQEWTVKLRQGVMFHPGPQNPTYEMTSEDVVFSLLKSANPEHSSDAGNYSAWKVEAADRYTVKITLEHPLSPALFFPRIANYSGGFIVSKKAIEAMGYQGFSEHPVGTGPFAFSTYQQGKMVALTAHPDYFRGTPRLDGVELHLLAKTEDRVAALEQGKLDVIVGSGDVGWISQFDGRTDVIADYFGVGEISSFYFNITLPPLDDIRVRQAIALALDREGFMATSDRGLGDKVFSQVPSQFLPGGLEEEMVRKLGLDFTVDRERAKALLAEAGYPEGFSIDLVSSEKRVYRVMYEELAKQLAQVGINCRLQVVPHADMHKAIRNTPQPITLYIAWRPNADSYLTRFFHSDSIIGSGAKPDTNFSAYRNIDKLIEAGRREIDPARQSQLWQQAQIKLLSDMAAFPVMYISQLFIRRAAVDYGHQLENTMALYPQITEMSTIDR